MQHLSDCHSHNDPQNHTNCNHTQYDPQNNQMPFAANLFHPIWIRWFFGGIPSRPVPLKRHRFIEWIPQRHLIHDEGHRVMRWRSQHWIDHWWWRQILLHIRMELELGWGVTIHHRVLRAVKVFLIQPRET